MDNTELYEAVLSEPQEHRKTMGSVCRKTASGEWDWPIRLSTTPPRSIRHLLAPRGVKDDTRFFRFAFGSFQLAGSYELALGELEFSNSLGGSAGAYYNL